MTEIFGKATENICDKAEEVYLRNLGAFSLHHIYDEVEQTFEQAVKSRMDCATVLFSACQSPIEEIMAAIIAFIDTGYDYVEYAGQANPKFGAVVRSQYEINKYRVDFLISCYCDDAVRHIAIECDGHDFHDKTKAQAARDKSRDRAITAHGVSVLRFTGSEIFRDPMKVGTEIESAVEEAIHAALAQCGHVRPVKDKLTGPALKDGPL